MHDRIRTYLRLIGKQFTYNIAPMFIFAGDTIPTLH